MTHILNSHSPKGKRRRSSPAISPRKAPSQARSQKTVEAILAATAHILSREGYAALSTNRVAERAGVSIGSLYQYFPSKDALVTALVQDEALHIASILAEHAGDAEAPFEQRVRGLVRGLIASHRRDPSLHATLVSFGRQLGEDSPLTQLQSTSITLIEEQLRAEPSLRVGDPALAAFLLYHAVEGALFAITHERPAMLQDGTRLEDEVCRLILRYLGAEGG
jgi:AcrR family transcriptional regulator